jgi:hypothetical protein
VNLDPLPDPRVRSPGPNKTPDGYRSVASVSTVISVPATTTRWVTAAAPPPPPPSYCRCEAFIGILTGDEQPGNFVGIFTDGDEHELEPFFFPKMSPLPAPVCTLRWRRLRPRLPRPPGVSPVPSRAGLLSGAPARLPSRRLLLASGKVGAASSAFVPR